MQFGGDLVLEREFHLLQCIVELESQRLGDIDCHRGRRAVKVQPHPTAEIRFRIEQACQQAGIGDGRELAATPETRRPWNGANTLGPDHDAAVHHLDDRATASTCADDLAKRERNTDPLHVPPADFRHRAVEVLPNVSCGSTHVYRDDIGESIALRERLDTLHAAPRT